MLCVLLLLPVAHQHQHQRLGVVAGAVEQQQVRTCTGGVSMSTAIMLEH
jgi:hypothetical protein